MRRTYRAEAPAATGRRLAYIDNLRWTMILLVLSMHAADTYSPLGNWYLVQRPPIGRGTLLVFAVWQEYLQSFFMGLLFFIAGVFTRPSIERKGPATFVRDRAFRLGLPVLLYMFVLGPLTEYYISHSWTAPYSFAHEWWHHIVDLEVLQENGPLWFLLALLIFSTVYAAVYRPGRRLQIQPTSATLIAFALAMAIGRFVIRGVAPDANLLNMHIGDFAQYILLFSAGLVAAAPPYKPWMTGVLVAGFVGWFALVTTGPVTDGWNWRSAAFGLWESCTCVAISVGLLALYRRRADTENTVTRFLSRNAFAVYVFHPPFVILGARLLWGVEWPALLKFVALWVLSAVVTFALCEWVFRRIPVLRQLL
jgi:glucans biosynthesis protein C